MAHREIERVRRERHLTPEEAAAERELRAKIEADLPSLRQQATVARLHKRGASLSQTIAALKQERERQGLSLKDIERRTGLDEQQLSRLEEQVDGDPTIVALLQYAEALGKAIEVKLIDASMLAGE
jgi:ABC-type phosphate transport system auxiliary subunit